MRTQTVRLRSAQNFTPVAPGGCAVYFCELAGEAAGELTGSAAGATLAAGEACGAGVGVASGAVDCKTE